MEPLVLVSAAVVLFYGYRTVMEVLGDVKEDESWRTVREALHQVRQDARSWRIDLQRQRSRRTGYYYNFFSDGGKRHPRVLLKPQA